MISVMTPPPMYMCNPFRSLAEVLIPRPKRGETGTTRGGVTKGRDSRSLDDTRSR